MLRQLPWRSAIPIFVLGAAITGLFLINLCDVIYDCGCLSLWTGATDHCNIHASNSRHCPWCTLSEAGFGAVYLGVIIPQGIISLWPRRRWLFRLGGALLAFPVIGSAIGVAMGLWVGYWN